MNKNIRVIPIIRGIYALLYQDNSKVLFLLFYILVSIIDNLYLKISLPDYIFTLYMIFVFFTVWKNKEIAELHGAEHMVCNYYEKYNNVSFQEIDNIKKASTIHDRCGTNDYITQFVILFLLKIFIKDFITRYLIMRLLIYEVSYYIDTKIGHYILYPLSKVGILVQKIFFVRQPRDKYVIMAINTVLELEKYENNKN